MSKKPSAPESSPPQGEFLLYQTEDGRTRIQCRFEEETQWLTQVQIADLFQITVPTVNEHLKGIFADGELESEATIRKFRIVRIEGARQVTREIEHYSLPAILSVGYRVRSLRGTQFRQWATARLQEYLVFPRAFARGLIEALDVSANKVNAMKAPNEFQLVHNLPKGRFRTVNPCPQ